ncbi:MAG: hypothetical protein HY597_05835 [Candidatus Omnitrophica bacterium]|nr:hypothetical protein [Candidatus Omnitrophota bacterium]
MTQVREFVEEPRPFTEADYVRLRERYTAQLLSIDGVRAVYEYGNTHYHPGISDIDLIAVTEERLSRRAARELTIYPLDDPAAVVMRGWANPCSVELFQQPLLAPYWEGSLRHRGGAVIAQTPLAPEVAAYAHLITVVDRCYQAVIGLMQRFVSHRWYVVATLSHLRAISHNVQVYERFTGTPLSGASKLGEAVADLRRTWFTSGPQRYQRMVTLVSEGLRVGQRLSHGLEQVLTARGWTRPWIPPEVTLRTDDGWTMAFGGRTADWAGLAPTSHGHRPALPLPPLALRQLYFIYRHAPDLLGPSLVRQLRTHAVHDAAWEFQGRYRAVLLDYLSLQQQRQQYLRRHRLPGRPCPGAWWHRLERRAVPTVQRAQRWLQARWAERSRFVKWPRRSAPQPALRG